MQKIDLIPDGKYSVSFSTPIGDGAGMVELCSDGTLTGGDATFSYSGNWSQLESKFKATLCAERVIAGPPGVFGLDRIDIVVSGLFDGSKIKCTGFAKQSPGIELEVVLTPS
jgi:hypothetical protein